MSDRHERRYKKGDAKAGGGGGRGGGGKRTRPPESWEKGDIARQVRAARPEADIPRKPGRAETEAEAEIAEHAAPSLPAELPELTRLRRINQKLLVTLRKLGGQARVEERVACLREVEAALLVKRGLESRLVPMLDAAGLERVLDELHDLDRAIDRQLAELEGRAPDEPAFTLGVHVLHGEIEQQIRRERERLVPAWAAIEPPPGAT